MIEVNVLPKSKVEKLIFSCRFHLCHLRPFLAHRLNCFIAEEVIGVIISLIREQINKREDSPKFHFECEDLFGALQKLEVKNWVLELDGMKYRGRLHELSRKFVHNRFDL